MFWRQPQRHITREGVAYVQKLEHQEKRVEKYFRKRHLPHSQASSHFKSLAVTETPVRCKLHYTPSCCVVLVLNFLCVVVHGSQDGPHQEISKMHVACKPPVPTRAPLFFSFFFFVAAALFERKRSFLNTPRTYLKHTQHTSSVPLSAHTLLRLLYCVHYTKTKQGFM